MSKKIIHCIILILTIGITFLFPRTNLVNYDIQISAGLFIILFVSKKFFVPKASTSKLMESVIFTLVVLGIVNTTGGTESSFFFLIYFLLFSLSLLLEPVVSITSTLTLILFFLLVAPENQNLKALLPIFSLAFLTPFAMFLGQEYIEVQKSKVKSQKMETDTYMFLSLVLRNHVQNIRDAVDNFMGDHELTLIKKSTREIEQLIEKYEKN